MYVGSGLTPAERFLLILLQRLQGRLRLHGLARFMSLPLWKCCADGSVMEVVGERRAGSTGWKPFCHHGGPHQWHKVEEINAIVIFFDEGPGSEQSSLCRVSAITTTCLAPSRLHVVRNLFDQSCNLSGVVDDHFHTSVTWMIQAFPTATSHKHMDFPSNRLGQHLRCQQLLNNRLDASSHYAQPQFLESALPTQCGESRGSGPTLCATSGGSKKVGWADGRQSFLRNGASYTSCCLGANF